MVFPPLARREATGTVRRAGYLASALVNLILMWAVNRLPDWNWPGFLTGDFVDLLPIVNLSFGMTVAMNLVWAWSDAAWLKHSGQIGLNLISVAVSIRTWQIFPFDFSSHSIDWSPLARGLILIALVGAAAATIAELVKLIRDTPATDQRR